MLEERKREREFGFVYASQSPFLKVFLVRFLDRTFISGVGSSLQPPLSSVLQSVLVIKDRKRRPVTKDHCCKNLTTSGQSLGQSLTETLFPILEDLTVNPDIGNFYIEHLFNCMQKK